jgi:hypothetical protein
LEVKAMAVKKKASAKKAPATKPMKKGGCGCC